MLWLNIALFLNYLSRDALWSLYELLLTTSYICSDLYLLQVWTTGTMGELSPVSLANLHLDFDELFWAALCKCLMRYLLSGCEDWWPFDWRRTGWTCDTKIAGGLQKIDRWYRCPYPHLSENLIDFCWKVC